MEKTYKRLLIWAIVIPVIIIFYFIIFLTVIAPLWRWGYLKQVDAIDKDVLAVVGAVVGFLSVVLAIVFQILSSFSGRRLEGAVKEIESTLLKNNDLTEQIVHNQDAITKGLVQTLGQLALRPSAGETVTQQLGGEWEEDKSR